MAAGISPTQVDRRRPAGEDVCPLDSKCMRTVGDTTTLDRRSQTASTPQTGSPTADGQEERRTGDGMMGEELVTMETTESSEDELGRLDIDLDRTSKQHNLTSSHVRAILHEVITDEGVVAMMKVAIRDTKDLPMFEPKMTRSRLKQAVQQGQPLNWSLSALNSAAVKPPQFVDIDLEEDEDSSDEEYCPDEEEEDDTAEETFLSDADSLATPPRMHHCSQPNPPADLRTDEPLQRCPGVLQEQVVASTCAPQLLLTSPESSFLERLNAVEDELDCSPAYTYQPLSRKATDDGDDDDGGGDEGPSCLAYRTRSKLRLVNVPLGQLEAELLAPDITADMYEQSPNQREEDRHWTKWLQGLMAPDNEEEADDDDDPEYNFLDDLDEPDLEDYRTDRAVQITKKEVNELLEELFDTLQEEDVAAEEQQQEEEEEQEAPSQTGPKFNIPQALRFDAPLAGMLTERRRTVRKQYEALQQRRALQDTSNHLRDNGDLKDMSGPQPNTITSVLVLPNQVCPALHLDYTQKVQLQQQIQQHVQLLTQVHLLSRRVDALNHEACITKHYLEELQQFAGRREEMYLPSSFRVWNLQAALDLLQEVEQRVEAPVPVPAASRRWLPRMSPATNSHAFPLLPVHLAWLFATRPVFLYPELLPVCSLDPALHTRRRRSVYTAGEDGLIVLGLKHFEGAVQPDQLISSYLLCKTRWNLRKHVKEMSGPRAPYNNIIKKFLTDRVVHPLPLACSRVQQGDLRPPVDRDTGIMPNWLKNSQLIIQKTRRTSTCYPPFLPPGCNLRLHPYWLHKSRQPPHNHRRLFTLAHNASLLPLAKAPADRPVSRQVERQVDMQPISCLSLPPSVSGALVLPPSCGAVPLADVQTAPTHPACTNIIQPRLPVGQRTQLSVARQHESSSVPLLLPLSSLTNPDTANPKMPCSAAVMKPGYFLLQMMWTPPTSPPTITTQHALGQQLHRPMKDQEEMDQVATRPERQVEEEGQAERQVEEEGQAERQVEEEGPAERQVEEEGPAERQVEEEKQAERQVEEERQAERQVEEENSAPSSTLSPLSSCAGEKEEVEEEDWTAPYVVGLNGGENTAGEEEEGSEGGGAGGGGEEEEGSEGGGAGGGGEEEEGSEGGGGEEEAGGGGGGEEDEEGQREDGGGEREEDGEKDKDEDQDRQGEEDEEEDFDDLTQDEDEEEVMSSASEESVLSVPELQETMKQLTWLATERRLCTDGDSEEDHSPTSPGSQEEEEEEEEEEGPKGRRSGEGRSSKAGGDEEVPSGEGTPRGGRRCPGRGRGRSRPLRGLRKSRQERHSKDAAKLLLLYDENILDNDPHRESKDMAFAQSYLTRVREALQDVPGQVEEFVSLLNQFEQVGEGQEVLLLFRKLRCILGERMDLLRDFAAFLHPEQALLCGLFEEQQAFDRSRRFLRQLEISFGDNPSHYQRIIKALQTGPDLSPASIHELKAQMDTLLKGHTHLQAEFWVFFDELRPPPARPGQFEEAHWPEDGGGMSDGGEGVGQLSRGGASSGFEEVTLPELEEEEEGHKIQPMTSRRRRRKMDAHRNYKDCDWSDKDWPCLCRDAKIRRHRRKGCSRCHSNKASGGVSRAMKSLDPLYAEISSAHQDPGDKDLDLKCDDDDSPQPDQSVASWDGAFPLLDEKEEEEELDDEEEDEGEEERSPAVKRSRKEEVLQPPTTSSVTSVTPTTSCTTSSSPPPPCMTSFTSSAPPSVTSSVTSVTPITSCTTSSSPPPPSVTSPSVSDTSVCTSSIFTSTSITSSVSPSPSVCTSSSTSVTSFSTSTSLSVCTTSSSSSAPPPDLPVCAKNISLTASGEKVILWTREADRVILMMCQQEGANQNTFQAISTLLGNKTPSEVSRRFRDLMSLFRTAARQTGSEDEATPTELAAANE